MAKKSFDVIVPHNHKVRPAELEAAGILANHFKANVRVLPKSERFKESSADFEIGGIIYELKSPITSSVRSINNLIQLATKQSRNVVIDIRKSKITEKKMVAICNERLKTLKKIKKIVLIVNKKIVLEFNK